MKDTTSADMLLQLPQAFHGSSNHPPCLPSHSFISSAPAHHCHSDDQCDAQAHTSHYQDASVDDHHDFLQPHDQAFHRSSTHHAGNATLLCGPGAFDHCRRDHDQDPAAPCCASALPQAYSALDSHDRRDDQDDTAAFRYDKLGQVSDGHLLQLHQAFHAGSSNQHTVATVPHCSLCTHSLSIPAEILYKGDDDAAAAAADIDDDQDDKAAVEQLLHIQALHGSSDNRLAYHEIGLQESNKYHASSSAHCNTIGQQAVDATAADHICEDEKHISHELDDHLHQAAVLHGSPRKIQSNRQSEDRNLRQRRSLAQAFANEDYMELLNLVRQSAASKTAFSGLVSGGIRHPIRKVEFSSCRLNTRSLESEESLYDEVDPLRKAHRCSSCSSFKIRADYTQKAQDKDHKYNSKEPYNHKICSISYKDPMKEQYVMRSVGLAFKWRPTVSGFKLIRSLFGGHQLHKAASSARVWVQEDEISSNLDTKLSSSNSSSHHKSITGDYISENSAKFSFCYSTSPKYISPTSGCMNGISTKNCAPSDKYSSCKFLTRFGSNLGVSSLPAAAHNMSSHSHSHSDSASFNSASSTISACKYSNTSGFLRSSGDGHYSASPNLSFGDSPPYKLADKKLSAHQSDQPKRKRLLQSLFYGKNLKLQLFLGKSELNHAGYSGQQNNYKANPSNPRLFDRNCYASSFHEELPHDSIQGAIAHCKQSMAPTCKFSS